MASRLYRTTQRLYRQVEAVFSRLGVGVVGSPTTVGLIALYVTGLILLDRRPTQTRVAAFLPARCHDALHRLLRLMPLSTRALMAVLIAFARRLGSGYLSLDDVIVEKPFAKHLRWAGGTYSFAKKRKVYGLPIVVVVWCSLDGHWRIPIAFRLWRPKRSCAPHDYRTKPQLVQAMLRAVMTARLAFAYVVFDTHYTSGALTKMLQRLGQIWVGSLRPNTVIVWRGHRQALSDLVGRVPLKWRTHLQVRAVMLSVYAPTYGHLRLVVATNRYGDLFYVASNDLTAELTTLVRRKRRRWQVETVFRDTKQLASLAACQCWVDQAMVRHVAFVWLTCVVLQMLRVAPDECVGQVKLRWQLEVLRDGQLPPPPLKACPAYLRSTA